MQNLCEGTILSDKGSDVYDDKGEPAIQGFAALEFRIPE